MSKLFTLTAAVLALTASCASAQDVGKSKDILAPKATEVEAPAPTVAPAPTTTVVPASADKGCRDIAVRITSIDKPANVWLTGLDVTEGILEALKACNDSTEVKAAPGAKSKGTVIIRVSQGVDKWARFSVPNTGGERFKFNYTHFDATGKRIGQFAMAEPLGTRNRVVLEAPANEIPVGGR